VQACTLLLCVRLLVGDDAATSPTSYMFSNEALGDAACTLMELSMSKGQCASSSALVNQADKPEGAS
jgi:hypothetical protein